VNNSSHLADATYDPATRKLRVTFMGGEVYEYSNVDQIDHEMLHRSQSPGSYLRNMVIPRYGKGRRVS
jgi:hypothetical protein